MRDLKHDVVIVLSATQRAALFQQTGRHLFRLRISALTGTASPVDRSCVRCLLNDALPDVAIAPTGVCNHCIDFERDRDNGAFDEIRVATVVGRKRAANAPDCAIAYSGGKDSAAVLLVALRHYGLRPLAILVDNGFIPHSVQESAADFCGSLGVPLVIRKIELASAAARALSQAAPAIPCRACIRSVFSVIASECQERNIDLVIAGYRFPPLQFPLSVCSNRSEHDDILCVMPLLAIRMPEKEQLRLLGESGWTRPPIAGNTSNCQLIGYVEEVVFDRIGYNPHIYEVSKEVRAGIYSREEGMKKLERPTLTDQHRREVMYKLGLAQ